MKNTFFLLPLLLWLGVATSAFAQRGQENTTPENKARKVAGQLQSKLSLSDEQMEKVYALNLNTIKDTRSLKAAKRNDMSGLKEGYEEIHQQYDQKMKEILSADQYSNWKKIQADARARKQKEVQEQTGRKKYNANEEDPEEEMTWEEAE